jgi:hypothetical protein
MTMRAVAAAAVLTLALAGPALAAEDGLPSGAAVKERALLSRTTSRARAFIRTQGRSQAESWGALTPAVATQALGPELEGLDMDVLVFLVTMETARDADAEMRAIMAVRQAAGVRREVWRDTQARAQGKAGGERRRSPGGGGGPLNAGVGDSVSTKLRPAEQLRLRRSMESYAEAISTVSGLMSKWSEPKAAVVATRTEIQRTASNARLTPPIPVGYPAHR